MRIDNVKYNAMQYIYTHLLGECKFIPDVFMGQYEKYRKIDPFKPYSAYDIGSGIKFKVWRDHNVIGTIAISHDGKKYKIVTPYHKFTTSERPVTVFRMVNDCIIGLLNNSTENIGREWGNARYSYDVLIR